MKKQIITVLVAAVAANSYAADISTVDNQITYAIGTQIGESLKNNVADTVKIDNNVLEEAITNTLAGKESQMTPEDVKKAMDTFNTKRTEARKKMLEEAESNNAAEAKKFLADNKEIAGTKVTDSGLEYRVITEGKGPKPKETDTVEVNYVGTLPDGTEFDSSIKRGQSATFPLNQVIKGWQEGVQLMSVGSKYEFIIPPELAYGESGPGVIGPNRALKFEVELLSIKDPKADADAAAKAPATPANTKQIEEKPKS